MIKSRAIKPILLVAFLGVILVTLVEPIAGDQMGQGNMTEQENMMCSCPENGMMMHCMMEEYAGNAIMGNHSGNEIMMHCMTMENDSANGTMMHCMMDQNNTMAQKQLDCASIWLEKAIVLHDLHMKDPKVAANESSQLELMDQMQKAYACLMGNNATGNMTMGMMNETDNDSTGYYQHNCPCSAEMRLECASVWLKKAIELHDLHLKDPKAAANESSQMEMMDQMMRAYACVTGKNMNMGMDQNISSMQTKLDCAQSWLEKAIKLHEVHLKDPSTATSESQMQMMDQMMRAYACITGKNMTGNMTMDMMTNTTAHASEVH